jgi:hypothetical protein
VGSSPLAHARAGFCAVRTPSSRPEDSYTEILEAILSPRLGEFLGWSLAIQPPGGFSEHGNPGKRDLVIKREGVDSPSVSVVTNMCAGWPSAARRLIPGCRRAAGCPTRPTCLPRSCRSHRRQAVAGEQQVAPRGRHACPDRVVLAGGKRANSGHSFLGGVLARVASDEAYVLSIGARSIVQLGIDGSKVGG